MLVFTIYVCFSLDIISRLIIFIMVEICLYRLLLSTSWFHVIILLMVLEMLILLVFLLINLTILSVKISGIFVFMFITLSVAEARVGISLLTMLVRRNGNDFIGVSIF